jgi:transposase
MKAYIGIDVAKRHHYAWILGAVAPAKNPFVFSHSEQGFARLAEWVGSAAPGQELIFGVEPTEPFSGALSAWLRQRGWTCHLIPGVYCRRGKYFYTNSGLKNDTIDAQVLAMLLRDGQFKTHVPQAEAFGELRELSNQYLRLASMRRAALQRIHSLVDHIWPEFSLHIKLRTKTALALLRRFARPSEVVALGQAGFEKFVWEVSAGKLKRETAVALYESAIASIGTPRQSHAVEMRIELELLDYFDDCYAEMQEAIVGWCQHIPYAKNLRTIPGFGPLLTGLLLGQAGDLNKYPTPRHLYKIAGVNLTERSSGLYKSPVRISRSGSPALRRCLFSAAASQCGGSHGKGIFREWYLERRERSIPRSKTVIAAARKLLRIAHAIARDGGHFRDCRLPTPVCT